MSRHCTAGDKRKAWQTGFLGRFSRDRSGSTAIEFVVLALPFSMLVFAILESCISFAGQEVMANAADDVARQLRTGQIKKVAVSENTIKNMICEKLEVIVSSDCRNQLSVDLREYGSFQEAAEVGFTITDGAIQLIKNNTVDEFTINPGKASTINMLRVFYKWPVMTDFMSKWMANLDDGKTLHFASITWQNEPFDD